MFPIPAVVPYKQGTEAFRYSHYFTYPVVFSKFTHSTMKVPGVKKQNKKLLYWGDNTIHVGYHKKKKIET